MTPIWRGLVLLGAVGGLAPTQPDLSPAGETLPQFNTLGGGKLAWRVRRERGSWKPF